MQQKARQGEDEHIQREENRARTKNVARQIVA
jgi:hypothetical protein